MSGSGYVQAPPDSAGKKVDSLEFTDDNNLTVERLRMDVPDGIVVSGDLIEQLLSETMLTNDILAQAFEIEISDLRNRE
jgi:hypothetical protein